MPFISWSLKFSAGCGKNSMTRDWRFGDPDVPPPPAVSGDKEEAKNGNENNTGGTDPSPCGCQADETVPKKDNNHPSSGCQGTSKTEGLQNNGVFLPFKRIGSFDPTSKQEINQEIQSSNSPASPKFTGFGQKPILDNDLIPNSNLTLPQAPHQMTGLSSVEPNSTDKSDIKKLPPAQLNGPSMNQARGKKRSWFDLFRFSPKLEETERKRLKSDSDEMVVMKTNSTNTLNHNEDSLQSPNHPSSMNINMDRNNENKNGDSNPKPLFTISDKEISTIPSLEEINAQITNTGDYNVHNLTVKHAKHGEVEFLGFRNLQSLGPETDICNLVSFQLGSIKIQTPDSFQNYPMQLTFANITRQMFASQVGTTREIKDPELDSIVIRNSQCMNAACCQYIEEQKKWVVLIVDGSRN